MTAKDKVARRKLSLLQLAQDLSNVSRACKVMGYSRQHFYEIRRNFQTYGAEGLIDRLPGAKGAHPNRVSAEIEQAEIEARKRASAILIVEQGRWYTAIIRPLLAAPVIISRPT